MARSRDDNKRKKVMLSAVSLFSTKGYAATSIQDIVSHSGLSVGTVYNYFENKEELLTSLIEDGWEDFFADVKESILEQKKENSFEYFYSCLFDIIEENIDLASLLISEPILYPKLKNIVRDISELLSANLSFLPGNIKNILHNNHDKSIIYVTAVGTIQAIKLSKKGFINIDVQSLKIDIQHILLKFHN